MHSRQTAEKRIIELLKGKDEFMKLSRMLAEKAQRRERLTIQPKENLSGTKAIITIGQNGFVVVSSEDPDGLLKALDAIKMVEEQAHVPNLTERIQEMLGSNSE